ncbi:SDR family NAD(P)-dependent oxidoreductase [Sediminispirochaeta bajacaliforniensis]|uniref:SDR family NAD(P)-dependent oxidoreductase n=1 Tax=Sediminispirochaeta bajacaliforniensis TaxID=148 RepID=UPI000365553C|nr:SDR family NAD(P)-dependent oxidoreductase [Sediminispirochaeta bajacaliforniensis]
MGKRVLITGKTTKLGNLLVEHYLSQGWQVVATVKQDEEKRNDTEIDSNLLIRTWNRRSPLAAKNVLLGGINHFGGIDEAIIIFPVDGENRPLHELPSAAIEAAVDGQIKSQLFMVKEVLAYFQKEKSGQLSLVRHNEGAEVLPPLDAVCSGSFQALSRSLFTFYQNEEVRINSFESSTGDTKGFVDFFIKTLDEKARDQHGKMYRFHDKGVLGALGRNLRK